jgi:hypothetical protein
MVLVRAQEIGLSNQNHFAEFRKGFGSEGFLDSIRENRQFGGPKEGPDQGKIVRSFIGELGAKTIVDSLNSKLTTPLEVYENIGLSRKRIDAMLRLAESERAN